MLFVFLFFKQKTAYELRISDWSSDVCSSDLFARGLGLGQHRLRVAIHTLADVGDREPTRGTLQQAHAQLGFQLADAPAQERLGNPKRAFGCGEATVVDDGGKEVEVVEVRHGCSSKFRTICDIRSEENTSELK